MHSDTTRRWLWRDSIIDNNKDDDNDIIMMIIIIIIITRYHEEVVVEGFRGRSRPLRILGYHSPTESHYEAKSLT